MTRKVDVISQLIGKAEKKRARLLMKPNDMRVRAMLDATIRRLKLDMHRLNSAKKYNGAVCTNVKRIVGKDRNQDCRDDKSCHFKDGVQKSDGASSVSVENDPLGLDDFFQSLKCRC